MSLKRKGGVEERACVICELQKERATFSLVMIVCRSSSNSIVQEVGSLIL